MSTKISPETARLVAAFDILNDADKLAASGEPILALAAIRLTTQILRKHFVNGGARND